LVNQKLLIFLDAAFFAILTIENGDNSPELIAFGWAFLFEMSENLN
jgi:hypothetical protein